MDLDPFKYPSPLFGIQIHLETRCEHEPKIRSITALVLTRALVRAEGKSLEKQELEKAGLAHLGNCFGTRYMGRQAKLVSF